MKKFNLFNRNVKKEEEIPQTAMHQTVMQEDQQSQKADGCWLYALEGPLKGQRYEVGMQDIDFGRDPSYTVVFPADAEAVSRDHCKLFWKDGVLVLMDLGSFSGTFVGGTKLTPMIPVPIRYQEVFYVGQPVNAFKVE